MLLGSDMLPNSVSVTKGTDQDLKSYLEIRITATQRTLSYCPSFSVKDGSASPACSEVSVDAVGESVLAAEHTHHLTPC